MEYRNTMEYLWVSFLDHFSMQTNGFPYLCGFLSEGLLHVRKICLHVCLWRKAWNLYHAWSMGANLKMFLSHANTYLKIHWSDWNCMGWWHTWSLLAFKKDYWNEDCPMASTHGPKIPQRPHLFDDLPSIFGVKTLKMMLFDLDSRFNILNAWTHMAYCLVYKYK